MPRTLDDGTEVFTADEIEARIAEANRGLEANRDAALRETKEAKAALRKLEEAWGDLDPDDVRALLADRAEADRKKAEADGDWSAREGQLTEAHGKERAKWEAENGKLRQSLREAIVTAKLTQAITAARGDAELLLPHADKFVDVTETADGFEAFVTDGHGNRMFADGEGTPMTFDQLVESRLMTKYPGAFAGTGSSGSGASKSAGGAGGSSTRVLAAPDNSAFIANVEAIAWGEVVVSE